MDLVEDDAQQSKTAAALLSKNDREEGHTRDSLTRHAEFIAELITEDID
jgi:hypothetical protein